MSCRITESSFQLSPWSLVTWHLTSDVTATACTQSLACHKYFRARANERRAYFIHRRTLLLLLGAWHLLLPFHLGNR